MFKCNFCGREDTDLRMGCCFDCATAGEARAAKRTVVQHLVTGVKNTLKGNWFSAQCDFSWAWERLTRTGDYQPGGYFDYQVPDWRGK